MEKINEHPIELNHSLFSNVSLINSKKKNEEDSFHYEYSISNISNTNKTTKSKKQKETKKKVSDYNYEFADINLESAEFQKTTLKFRGLNENFEKYTKQTSKTLDDLYSDYADTDNEIIEIYNEYLSHFKSTVLKKFRIYQQKIDEITNERDEYKEQIEYLSKEIELKDFELNSERKNFQQKLTSELEKEKQNLLNEHKSMKKTIEELNYENEMQRNEFNDICNKLSSKIQDLEKINIDIMSQINEFYIKEILLEIVYKSEIISISNKLNKYKEENSLKKKENLELQKIFDQKIRQYEDKLTKEKQNNRNSKIMIKANSSFQNENSCTDLTNTSSSNITLKSEAHESNPIKILKKKIDYLKENKEKIRKKIQDWNDEFFKINKRKPTVEDKIPISNLYTNYNELNKLILENENNINPINSSKIPSKINNMKIFNKNNSNISLELLKKNKSVSPRKAHLAKISNSFTVHESNKSFDIGNLGDSKINKLNLENKLLRNEINNLRNIISNNNSINENDIVNNLKIELKNLTNEKDSLNQKLYDSFNNKSINEIDEEKKNNTIILHEQKYNKNLKEIEDNYKNKISEITKTKDLMIKKLEDQLKKLKQDLLKLKENYEKNNIILLQSNEKLMTEKQSLSSLKTSLENQLRDEISQRKHLHNYIEDLKGKIRVYCRVRPLLSSEIDRGCKNVISRKDDLSLIVETKNGPKFYNFDSCYNEFSSQEEVFEDCKKLIKSVVDGYNVCIFAYGQTGSGKTFTMQGELDKPGIVPKSVEELYKLIENMSCEIKVNCIVCELYMDTLIDLLIPKEKKNNNLPHLEIKEDSKGNIFINNITTLYAKNKEDLEKMINFGISNRKISRTEMNDESSRSHLIITISVEIYNKRLDQKTIGKLSLIDLAGSERVNKSNLNCKQMTENKGINKSLSALGNVIFALSNEEKFIPYRDNKLTLIMKDSLGGSAKTLMILNLSPADYNVDETINSLYYGTRVKNIVNDHCKNVENQEKIKLKEQLKLLAEENEGLKKICRKGKEKENFSKLEPIRKDNFVLNEIKN